MNTVGIRGAITAEHNTTRDIAIATTELFEELLKANNLKIDNIISITFSITKDLNATYPAKELREKFNLSDTPLFCTQEADIHGSIEKCIRILILANSDLTKKDVKHLYLKGAKSLRPDLSK